MADYKTIDIECPHLLKEWDYKKNSPLLPTDVRKYSNKRVWWKCKFGHSWQAPISRRTGGSGCPYCTGNLVWLGFNDLATTHPDVALEWDTDKNEGLTARDVSAGCNKNIWWKCIYGHSWSTTVASRTAGTGCPYCAGKKVITGQTDLKTLYPCLISEWDYEKNKPLIPEQITAFSNKKVWWLCSEGHSWYAPVYVRAKGHSCPYCSGKKAIPGENDIKTLYPQIASEWDYEKNGDLRPENVKKNSNQKVWWKCSKNHSWQTTVYHRTRGNNCPVCAGKKVWEGFNDLETKFPDVALQWDYEKNKDLTPRNVIAFSNKKVWWVCEKGHSSCESIYTRTRSKKCPVCLGKTVLEGYNDLATVCPEIAAEWNYEKNKNLKPTQITASSNKMVWWACDNGHEWQAVVYSRKNGNGCPYCTGRYIIEGETDFKTLRPDIAGEWDYSKNKGLLPEHMSAASNQKVWWICPKGHSYKATVSNRQYGKNCPYCAGKYPILGETDLVTTHPYLIKEWDWDKNGNKKPENYTAGSNKSVWWKCSEGHSWKSKITDRNAGNNCPTCYGRIQMRMRLIR